MKLERLLIRHLTSLNTVDLDLTQVPEGVIAVTGENGAGKTTLLESPLAALFRTLPSRGGDLKTYATAKDTTVETQFAIEGFGTFVARVNVDGVKGSSDAVLVHQGVVMNDGKVSSYDAAIREQFPPLSVLLASSFALQSKRGQFIEKKPKDRKELFAEVLGLQAYEGMSQTAKTLVGKCDVLKVRVQAMVDELARRTADAIVFEQADHARDLAAEAKVVRQDHESLLQRIVTLREELAAQQEALSAHKQAASHLAALTGHVQRAKDDLDHLMAHWARTTVQLGTDLKAITAQGDATRTAIERKAEATLADLTQRIATNEQLLAQANAIRAAVTTLADIEGREQALRDALDAATADQTAAADSRREREQQLTGLTRVEEQLGRARKDAELIDQVPFGEQCAEAQCQFLTDAIAAQHRIPMLEADLLPKARLLEQISQLTAAITAHKATVAQLTADRSDLQQDRSDASVLAAFADKLTVAETRLSELQTAKAALDGETAQRIADAAAAVEEQKVARQAVHDTAALTYEASRVTLTARHKELLGQQQEADTAVMATAGTSAAAHDVEARLDTAREQYDRSTVRLATIVSEERALERDRQVVTAALERKQQLEAQLVALDTERLAWHHLQTALGRDGLPVLEMDAAGPRISQLTNELLLGCFGPRFSVELVTQEAKADGKGMKESFALLVTDNERGAAVRDVGDLSGGEQVIVSEALMNAIALYVQQHTAVPLRTCWRDETTGALDPEHADRYLQMLRQVHALGNYAHIFFITHNAAIAAQADAQIHVADGTATIQLPPYDYAA